MKTMDIIFNDEDYYDELVSDLTVWCEREGIPMDKVILNMKEDNIDDITYFVITVNETLFGFLMWRVFIMSEQYGREGWNRWVESTYNCETT